MAPLHLVRSVFSLCLQTPVRQSWFSRFEGTTISALLSHGWAAALVANIAGKHASARVRISRSRPEATHCFISRSRRSSCAIAELPSSEGRPRKKAPSAAGPWQRSAHSKAPLSDDPREAIPRRTRPETVLFLPHHDGAFLWNGKACSPHGARLRPIPPTSPTPTSQWLLQVPGHFSCLSPFLDDPEVPVFLDYHLSTPFNVSRCHRECTRPRAGLLPVPPRERNALGPVHVPTLTAKTRGWMPSFHPFGLALVEVSEPGLVLGDAFLV